LRQWRSKKKQKKSGGWTPEEDDLLREAVALYGENWPEGTSSSLLFQLRSSSLTLFRPPSVELHTSFPAALCLTRWTKTLNPTITRGKWSPSEDAVLLAAIEEVGKNWRRVCERVEGRTDSQCRERWTNVLDPRLLDKRVWGEEVRFFFCFSSFLLSSPPSLLFISSFLSFCSLTPRTVEACEDAKTG
jgi:hypothetical protein